MYRWIIFSIFSLICAPLFAQDNSLTSSQKQYLEAIEKTREYIFALENLYQDPTVQLKLISVLAQQQMDIDPINVKGIESMVNKANFLMLSPFVKPIKNPKNMEFLKKFKPDQQAIQQLLEENDTLFSEIQYRKNLLDSIDKRIFTIFGELVQNNKIWLNLLLKM